MTSSTEAETAAASPPSTRDEPELRGRTEAASAFRNGWQIIARKELADHLLSARFAILLVLLALFGLGWLTAVAGTIGDVAEAASQQSSVFLLLFTVPVEQLAGEQFNDQSQLIGLLGLLAPLLGLTFGFTAINNEQASRTLPRLVSQPIHRDDVITGKFAAGLGLITAAFGALLALLCGYGIVQLGITPDPDDLARIIAYFVILVLYVGVWLALGILLSVLTRSAVTAVLIGIALWLVLTIFFPLISNFVADRVAATDENATIEEQLDHFETRMWLRRASPQGIYLEASTVMLDPSVRSTSVPSDLNQIQYRWPGPNSTEQSLLLIWPHVAALVACIVVLFSIAFVQFLQQEVRA